MTKCALCPRVVEVQLGPFIDICEFCVKKQENRKRRREASRFTGRLRIGPHDLTLGEYEQLLASQNGVCAICEEPPPPGKRLVIDHDHTCHKAYGCRKCIRGLLCSGCNTGLGGLGDNIEGLKRALAYLERHEARGV